MRLFQLNSGPFLTHTSKQGGGSQSEVGAAVEAPAAQQREDEKKEVRLSYVMVEKSGFIKFEQIPFATR